MLTLVLALTGCQPIVRGRSPAQVPLVVAADGVLCDLVGRLAGAELEVACLLEPGSDPHQLRLSPRQRAQLAQARVVLINGYGLTPALQGRPGTEAVAERAVPDSPRLGAGPARDPHVWHDPRQASAMALWLSERLGQLAPSRRAPIEARGRALQALLADLDRWNRRQLATIPLAKAGRPATLATPHRAFTSLTRAYGLRELALVDDASSSAGLRPAALQHTLAALRQERVPRLFGDQQPPPRNLQRLSQLSGVPLAAQPLVADGLAPAGPTAPSLMATLVANTCTISEGLGGRCDRRGGAQLISRWQAIGR